MALQKKYIDNKVFVSGKTSVTGMDNAFDVQDYVEKVLENSASTVDAVFDSVETDTILENTAAAGVTIDSVKLKDGGVSNTGGTAFAGFYFTAASNNITAGTGGAISVANYLTTINTDAGGDAFTLASGTQLGQIKKIMLVADGGGDAVVTGAFTGANNTLTFNDAGEFAVLIWDGTDWLALQLGSEGTFTDAPVISTV